MLRTALRTASALAIFAATLGVIFAQPPEVRKTQKPSAQMALRAKSILGATVQLHGSASASVGTIEDIVFDDEGVIDYFIVSEKGRMVTVPWEAAKFNFEKRTAEINLAPDQFSKVPSYTAERYPDFYAPAYRTEIYGYYNLRPGQERRFERRVRR
jgi:PRC-barrel domain